MAFDKLGSKKNQLYSILGESTVEKLKASNAILAGGALTSLFTNTEINDFDLYFHNEKDLARFIALVYNNVEIANMFDTDLANSVSTYDSESTDNNEMFKASIEDSCPFEIICNSVTDRSVLLTTGVLNLQAIYFNFFEDAHAIFDSFDFTINMVAFDFSTETFIFHDDFFIDIASKSLSVNTKTQYPIISLLRVDKYMNRGYKMSKKEHFKLAMAINALSISTWEEMKDQLSGFYGLNVDDIFDESKEFSLEVAIDMLSELEALPIQHLKSFSQEEIIKKIFEVIGMKLPSTYYKVLLQKDGKFVSPYRNSFVWDITGKNHGGENGLWMYTSRDQASESHWNSDKEHVVVKLRVSDPDQVEWEQIGSGTVVAKCDVFIEEIYFKK